MSRLARLLRDNALGVIAITIALSAGAYAATDKAPKDSVVSSSIKNGQVKSVDLRDRAVDGSKVEDNSLTGADVDESSLALAAGAVGTAQVADGSLVASDLGVVQNIGAPSATLTSGTCASPTTYVTGGAGTVGDFVVTTPVPPLPAGFLASVTIGPVAANFRQYFVSVCNFSASTTAIPPGTTLKLLVIHQ